MKMLLFNFQGLAHGLPDGSAVSLGGAHVTIMDAQRMIVLGSLLLGALAHVLCFG